LGQIPKYGSLKIEKLGAFIMPSTESSVGAHWCLIKN